ncbi:MAG: alkaline phosphatase family protein [Calditrichae bacterium]|nr:alkaline phosphatase family protein [Calditrichia bacterium]
MKQRRSWLLLLTLIFLLPMSGRGQQKPPRLVVMLVVDQMRADHLTRFSGIFRHGFARIAKNAAIYTNAHHEHAYTVTGAGHATIATGAFPAHNGIVNNDWYDKKLGRNVYCCEDTSAALIGFPQLKPSKGRSAQNLLTSTLGDWLKTQSPESKVYGVAKKDRASILSTGMKADGAYWFDSDNASGNIITSKFYGDTIPEWVNAFNRSRQVDSYFDAGWQKLKGEETYFLAREDTFPGEAGGDSTFFPHSFKAGSAAPDKKYYDKLTTSPFHEQLMLAFAKTLVEQTGLGSDDVPDLLFLGASACDAIGHDYGPMSQESMDYFLRLDEYLGDFFDFLDARIGAENYLIALGSDHGVLPLPEELQRRGIPARRLPPGQLKQDIENVFLRVGQELGIGENYFLKSMGYSLYLDYEVAQRYGVDPQTLDQALAAQIRQIEGVADVYTKADLAPTAGEQRPYQARHRNSFHPERTGDLMLRLKEFYLSRSSMTGTTHGSTYDYDTHVPIVFSGPGISAGVYDQKVRTVDIAPTLAKLFGITPPEGIDGVALF